MTTEKIIQLSLAATRESPFNPRKHFNPVKLQELAESIKSQGVMSPVVARTVPSYSGWELVFGHRRFRAAQLAGLDSIPAVIRDMSDEAVKVAQIHENLLRDDVTALEEAEGFRALMDDHGLTAEQLIADSGKSKSYIYGRLKLLNLCDAVRSACESDELPAEIAVAIARIPTAAMQKKALELVREKGWVDGQHATIGWKSTRAAKLALKGASFTIPLKDASEGMTTDATLSDDGRACTSCALCSDNDPDLTDLFGAGVCTDTDCFDARHKRLFETAVDLHRAQGGVVLADEEAAEAMRTRHWPTKYQEQYVCVEKAVSDGGPTIEKTLAQMGEAAPPVVMALAGDGEPIRFIARKDLDAVLTAAGIAPEPHQREQEDEATDTVTSLPLTEEEEACRQNWGEILRYVLKACRNRDRSTDELRLVLAYMLEALSEIPAALAEVMGWEEELAALDGYGEDVEWLTGKLAQMTADEIGALAVMIALCDAPYGCNYRDQPPALVLLAKSYGINPLDPEALPTPSTAAQAPEGGAKKRKSKPKASAPVPVQADLVEEEQAGSAGMNEEGSAGAADAATEQASEVEA